MRSYTVVYGRIRSYQKRQKEKAADIFASGSTTIKRIGIKNENHTHKPMKGDTHRSTNDNI